MSITGQRLKERRKEIGISADDVASELGVSRSTIFRYENGQIEKVPANVIEELARILKTTPAYLMGWTDDSQDWEQIANVEGICPPNDYDGDPEDWFKMKMLDNEAFDSDSDLSIIQRERSKMSPKEKTKLMNILKANFDDYNWEEDDSGDIE